MTDTAFHPAALAEIEDVELVFDATPPASKKSRRTPRKGIDADAGADASADPFPPSAAPEQAAAEEPADPPAPVPQPGDASAGSATASAFGNRRRIMLGALVGGAMLTSLMSLGGLIAVSRNLAALGVERADVAKERTALASVPAMVAAIERASARLPAAPIGSPMPPPAPSAAAALTADDLHRSLDDLRLALDNRQPAGMSAMSGTVQSGFTEIATRLDRIEAAMPPRVLRPAPPSKRN